MKHARVGSMYMERLQQYLEKISALETAVDQEKRQRVAAEEKYARLKRKYIRLEREHSKVMLSVHGVCDAPMNNSAEMASPDRPTLAEDAVSNGAGHVIDLTSPRVRGGEQRRQRLQSPDTTDADFVGVTPTSSHSSQMSMSDEAQRSVEQIARAVRRRGLTPPSRRHLDFFLPESNQTSHDDEEEPNSLAARVMARRRRSEGATSTAATSMATVAELPRSTRPQLRRGMEDATSLTDMPVRRSQRIRQWLESDDILEAEEEHKSEEPSPVLPPRSRRSHHLIPQLQTQQVRPRPRRSPPVAAAATASARAAPRSPVAVQEEEDSGEAASIALARYLQEQEVRSPYANIAALQDFELRIRAAAEAAAQSQNNYNRPTHPDDGAAHSSLGFRGELGVDPDNMTYEELLQLGERVGDVKKERWREIAVQVLSSLPTHRWTADQKSDIPCIVCQYDFVEHDKVLTLPCAHIFHEECVEGWVRENNSCPLCKMEISDV
ncbi:TPA: hypothetical protein N0F65_012913 [Lagenidium giganteum]|uniref:RING-type domain-containing protein n=1 Tax=Lagenidium giganteum TaxID=4803 RepID=A0AAV2YUJ6_9STRA|nr:TPA: hypothetical protein N0F65_012913 [Lagenidium giganteum]